MKKIVRNILIILYLSITFIVTYSLLSYNDYNIAEFNKFYLCSISENVGDYRKGDLLIIKKNSVIKENDLVVYYNVVDGVTNIDGAIVKVVNDDVVVLKDDLIISKDNILGNNDNITSYSKVGCIYDLITSKWGYLLIIILPILIAFIYEISEIIKEIKKK